MSAGASRLTSSSSSTKQSGFADPNFVNQTTEKMDWGDDWGEDSNWEGNGNEEWNEEWDEEWKGDGIADQGGRNRHGGNGNGAAYGEVLESGNDNHRHRENENANTTSASTKDEVTNSRLAARVEKREKEADMIRQKAEEKDMTPCYTASGMIFAYFHNETGRVFDPLNLDKKIGFIRRINGSHRFRCARVEGEQPDPKSGGKAVEQTDGKSDAAKIKSDSDNANQSDNNVQSTARDVEKGDGSSASAGPASEASKTSEEKAGKETKAYQPLIDFTEDYLTDYFVTQFKLNLAKFRPKKAEWHGDESWDESWNQSDSWGAGDSNNANAVNSTDSDWSQFGRSGGSQFQKNSSTTSSDNDEFRRVQRSTGLKRGGSGINSWNGYGSSNSSWNQNGNTGFMPANVAIEEDANRGIQGGETWGNANTKAEAGHSKEDNSAGTAAIMGRLGVRSRLGSNTNTNSNDGRKSPSRNLSEALLTRVPHLQNFTHREFSDMEIEVLQEMLLSTSDLECSELAVAKNGINDNSNDKNNTSETGLNQGASSSSSSEPGPSEPGSQLAAVVGLSGPKEFLLNNLVLPLVNPGLYSSLRAPSRGLLLFGPGGNGKVRQNVETFTLYWIE
jgi:hypothetical protein